MAAIKEELSKIKSHARHNVTQVAEYIYRTSRRIFATLVMMKKAGQILRFIAGGISDDDLALNPSKMLNVSCSTDFISEGLESWGDRDTFEFHRTQWAFLAPTFDFRGPRAPHLDLPDDTILSRAINRIHNDIFKSLDPGTQSFPDFQKETVSSKHIAAPNEYYGCHEDIEPEILFSAQGVLIFSDLGRSRFHRTNSRPRLQSPHQDINPAPTDAASPRALDKPISRKYDIWSFACAFLEFLTWFLRGSEGVESFLDARLSRRLYLCGPDSGIVDDCFYSVDLTVQGERQTTRLKESLRQWIHTLRRDPRSSLLIHALLNVVEGEMLIVDTARRTSSEKVIASLEDMVRQNNTVEGYAGVGGEVVPD